ASGHTPLGFAELSNALAQQCAPFCLDAISASRVWIKCSALCRMEPGVSSAASRGRQYARLTAQSLRTRQSCGSLRGIACNRDPLGDAAGVRRTMTGPYDYQ